MPDGTLDRKAALTLQTGTTTKQASPSRSLFDILGDFFSPKAKPETSKQLHYPNNKQNFTREQAPTLDPAAGTRLPEKKSPDDKDLFFQENSLAQNAAGVRAGGQGTELADQGLPEQLRPVFADFLRKTNAGEGDETEFEFASSTFHIQRDGDMIGLTMLGQDGAPSKSIYLPIDKMQSLVGTR